MGKQTHRALAAGQTPPDTAHSCLVSKRDGSSGVKHPKAHLPSPWICRHCLFTQELPRKEVNEEDLQQQLLGVISCSCDRRGQLRKTLWLQIWLFIPPSTQITAQSLHRVLHLGHCPFMCTANKCNSCKSGRGRGVLRSSTASSGWHPHFQHMCKVHLDLTFFTTERDHRNCLHCVENVLNRILPRTKILCKTLSEG